MILHICEPSMQVHRDKKSKNRASNLSEWGTMLLLPSVPTTRPYSTHHTNAERLKYPLDCLIHTDIKFRLLAQFSRQNPRK